MSKLFLGSLFALLFSVAAFAQNSAPTPADWREFKPFDEEFSAEIPVDFKLQKYSTQWPSRRYVGRLDDTFFFIFSDASKQPLQTQFIKYYLQELNFNKNTFRRQKSVAYGPFGAVNQVYAGVDHFWHTVLTVTTESRTYTVEAVGPAADDAAVDRFFKSLRFGGHAADDALLDRTEAEKERRLSTPDLENGGSSAAAARIAETKPTATPNATPIPGRDAPLSITGKTPAAYNDTARFYQIGGTVALRVTFLADGRIGAVTPARKLPFGLTESAIEAARKIAFEPAMRSGIRVAVAKTVEYNFTID